MAGAKNISNPNVDPLEIAIQVAQENFPAGYLGTPSTGPGVVTFNAESLENHRIKLTGTVKAPVFLSSIFGIQQVSVGSSGVAKKNEVEIMLVLDRSGSMAGTPLSDLKDAAASFVDYFEETQDKDKMGLITFATGVKVNTKLDINFVNPIKNQIKNMNATGATNAEDAIDQCNDSDDRNGSATKTLTDQTGVPGDQRVQQYVIFFTDGRPTAFRNTFTYKGTDYDAVVCGTGNYCDDVYEKLGKTYQEEWWNNIEPRRTGDGLQTNKTKCERCTGWGWWQRCEGYLNTRWKVLEGEYGTGMEKQYCNYDVNSYYIETTLADFIRYTAKQMAIDYAQDLKDQYVKIYTIGLGNNIDEDFLSEVASGPTYEYYAPNSDELEAIFNAIAKEIKLRLVQ
jgi:uncharacterized protein YegL